MYISTYESAKHTPHIRQDLQSVWLRALNYKMKKLKAMLQTQSFKQEDIVKNKRDYYQYYITTPQTGKYSLFPNKILVKLLVVNRNIKKMHSNAPC
jgi:hypothetical protein